MVHHSPRTARSTSLDSSSGVRDDDVPEQELLVRPTAGLGHGGIAALAVGGEGVVLVEGGAGAEATCVRGATRARDDEGETVEREGAARRRRMITALIILSFLPIVFASVALVTMLLSADNASNGGEDWTVGEVNVATEAESSLVGDDSTTYEPTIGPPTEA